MEIIYVLLLLASLVCFIAAAVKYRGDYKGKQLIAVGLALWVAVPLLEHLTALD